MPDSNAQFSAQTVGQRPQAGGQHRFNVVRGELEIVYPRASIRAEPPVAVVDANVDRRGTRAVAEAYLQFLYTPDAQRIIAEAQTKEKELLLEAKEEAIRLRAQAENEAREARQEVLKLEQRVAQRANRELKRGGREGGRASAGERPRP